MIDLAPESYTRVLTAFGTVLYVDARSGELRHGAIETSPANAYFLAGRGFAGSRRRGWLVHDTGDSREPITCLAERCHRVSPEAGGHETVAPTTLELIPLERGLIAFKAADLFLSAIPDGQIRLIAQRCSTWELFLASEDRCAHASQDDEEPAWEANDAGFDRKRIKDYLVHPLIRARANAEPKARKILIYGYTKWSHGRVYYDLSKRLHRHGYIVDILDWQVNHAGYIEQLIPYYDFFMTALDGIRPLVDLYNIPYDRIIAVSHSEFDIRMLIDQRGIEIFKQFANYGVVSESLYCASLMRGVTRVPMVASLGVNYKEFFSDISESLQTVGYASSMSDKPYGIEVKRGDLAEGATREAGLTFKIAGSTGKQISFHDMPDFYRSVDAIVTSSISETANLPGMEAAAAGRLVIGTPVGHFALRAYQGGGIIAPIESEKFKQFTASTLRYYKENPAAYVDKCCAIQEAARKFDWQHAIGDWIALIEAA